MNRKQPMTRPAGARSRRLPEWVTLAAWSAIVLTASVLVYGAIALFGAIYRWPSASGLAPALSPSAAEETPSATAPVTALANIGAAPPTAPPQPTATASPTASPTPTATSTVTPPPVLTATSTPLSSATNSFNPPAAPTRTRTPKASAAPTQTWTAAFTPTYTRTSNATATPTNTRTLRPTTAPTNTRTPTPTLAITISPSHTPTSTPTSTPTLTPTSTATIRPTPTTDPGWAFSDVRLYPDSSSGGLLVTGNITNNTGSAQELSYVTGIFYDAQGQIIADLGDVNDNWPSEVIPPGGRMPFALSVIGIQSADSYNLSVGAASSSETPRQDFEFSAISQQSRQNAYCVAATLRNPGNELQDYLVIAAVLYDGENKVINFADYIASTPIGIVGDDTLDFEICVGLPNDGAARYELIAWGR